MKFELSNEKLSNFSLFLTGTNCKVATSSCLLKCHRDYTCIWDIVYQFLPDMSRHFKPIRLYNSCGSYASKTSLNLHLLLMVSFPGTEVRFYNEWLRSVGRQFWTNFFHEDWIVVFVDGPDLNAKDIWIDILLSIYKLYTNSIVRKSSLVTSNNINPIINWNCLMSTPISLKIAN